MTIFEAAKDLVSMAEAAGFYGYHPNRAGFIRCPFHNEKTASLKLYDSDFHCFGCGAHGTVIDFVAQLFSIDPLAAVKRLNEDFNLGIDLDRPPDPKQLRRRRKAQEAQQRFDVWREGLLNRLDRAIRTANLAGYPATDAEALALRFREPLESWADGLMHGSMAEQMQIFRDREGIERLCEKILKNTPMRSTAV